MDVFEACKNGNFMEVKKYLESGQDPNCFNLRGNPLLYVASYYNRLKIIKLLLKQKNINVNINNPYNTTTLHYLSYENNLKATKLLLEAGANPNIQGLIGDTPLYIALCFNNIKMAKLLLRYGAKHGTCLLRYKDKIFIVKYKQKKYLYFLKQYFCNDIAKYVSQFC